VSGVFGWVVRRQGQQSGLHSDTRTDKLRCHLQRQDRLDRLHHTLPHSQQLSSRIAAAGAGLEPTLHHLTLSSTDSSHRLCVTSERP